MATLSEHADNIKAAIKAAQDDGLKLEFDVSWDGWESSRIETIELDIWEDTQWVNVYTEER